MGWHRIPASVFRGQNRPPALVHPNSLLVLLLANTDQGSASMRGIAVTTEEEGVVLLAGAWAGGQRGVLLMQSSGVGNCINMFSLTQIFRFPFLTLVTMRGEWGEFNPWQVPMGSSTEAVFELSGIKVLRASSPEEVREVVEAGAMQAYNACTPTAVLLSQRLIGTKVFTK